jgi:hypothetical protein
MVSADDRCCPNSTVESAGEAPEILLAVSTRSTRLGGWVRAEFWSSSLELSLRRG